MDRIVKIGKKYRHFKNKEYEVLALAKDCETLEDIVVYKALYGDGQVWTRNADDFLSKVDKEKYPDVKQENRFEEIN